MVPAPHAAGRRRAGRRPGAAAAPGGRSLGGRVQRPGRAALEGAGRLPARPPLVPWQGPRDHLDHDPRHGPRRRGRPIRHGCPGRGRLSRRRSRALRDAADVPGGRGSGAPAARTTGRRRRAPHRVRQPPGRRPRRRGRGPGLRRGRAGCRRRPPAVPRPPWRDRRVADPRVPRASRPGIRVADPDAQPRRAEQHVDRLWRPPHSQAVPPARGRPQPGRRDRALSQRAPLSERARGSRLAGLPRRGRAIGRAVGVGDPPAVRAQRRHALERHPGGAPGLPRSGHRRARTPGRGSMPRRAGSWRAPPATPARSRGG